MSFTNKNLPYVKLDIARAKGSHFVGYRLTIEKESPLFYKNNEVILGEDEEDMSAIGPRNKVICSHRQVAKRNEAQFKSEIFESLLELI